MWYVSILDTSQKPPPLKKKEQTQTNKQKKTSKPSLLNLQQREKTPHLQTFNSVKEEEKKGHLRALFPGLQDFQGKKNQKKNPKKTKNDFGFMSEFKT